MDTLSDEIESVLWVGREALVYRVPPRSSNEGYKAASWNDQGMLWKGRIRILETSTKCEIRLEDPTTGELFALTNYSPDNNSVEPVLDSSRYFVLRVEGEGGRKAYIGLGFEERGDAFDFNVALQSFSKRLSNPNQSADPKAPPPPTQDFSLKEGQTFSIKIPGREGSGRKRPESNSTGGNGGIGGGIPLLAPPPGKKR